MHGEKYSLSVGVRVHVGVCFGMSVERQIPVAVHPETATNATARAKISPWLFVWWKLSHAATCLLVLQNLPLVRLQVRARACPASGFLLWHQRRSPPCSRNLWVKAHKASLLLEHVSPLGHIKRQFYQFFALRHLFWHLSCSLLLSHCVTSSTSWQIS